MGCQTVRPDEVLEGSQSRMLQKLFIQSKEPDGNIYVQDRGESF